MRNGSTRRERANALWLKAQRLQPCARCKQPIDYNAKPGEPDAFNAGHIRSVKHFPHLRYDRANLQPEHESCNKSAQAREDMGSVDQGATSRAW